MKRMGLQGAIRGKRVKTTISHPATPYPADKVERNFRADRPNALWLSDFTYVSTWAGFVYVAFVIDAFAHRIVGWKVSSSMQTDFVLDALEQVLHDRRPFKQGKLIHHSDRGVQGGFNRSSQQPVLALLYRWIGATRPATRRESSSQGFCAVSCLGRVRQSPGYLRHAR
jgi:putative transposase